MLLMLEQRRASAARLDMGCVLGARCAQMSINEDRGRFGGEHLATAPGRGLDHSGRWSSTHKSELGGKCKPSGYQTIGQRGTLIGGPRFI